MLRSIKSGQRKMRVIALKVLDKDTLADSLDFRQVTILDGVITVKVPFAQEPVVLGASALNASAVSVSEIAISDAAGDLLIVGSDTAEKY